MATTRAAIKKRVEQVAVQLRCCPQHPAEQLRCIRALVFVGTATEESELHTLGAKIILGDPPLRPTQVRCQVCGQALWCEPCMVAQAQTWPVQRLSDVLTDAEIARYEALKDKLTWTAHGTVPKPMPQPPVEPPEVTFESNSDAPPMPQPPVVSIDTNHDDADLITDEVTDDEADDDDIDIEELRSLVRQEFERLRGAG